MANWRVLAGLTLVVGLVALVFVILLYSLTGGTIPFDHGVIIDAGSSHSEILLYNWEGDKDRGTGAVKEVDKCDATGDGISSYTVPEEAGASLIPCLQEMASRVPEEKRSTTPVYLGATAGMRLLNISNPYMNLATFTAIRCAIPQSGLMMEEAGIISGQAEGLYAWITSNFLLGTIQRREHPTLGALDMGGASTQISFEVSEANKDLEHVITRRLYGETYHIFSITYLCYGAFEIYRRYHSQLITNKDVTGNIDSPCMNKGYDYEHDATFLFKQPCTETAETIKEFILNPEKLNKTYNFVGTSDIDRCREAIAKVFDHNDCQKKYRECFVPIDEIKMSKEFMALSSYAYTTQFLEGAEDTLDQYRAKSENHCKKTWAEVEAMKVTKAAAKVLPRFCLQGIAVEWILTEGYGFNESTWKDITFTTKVKDTSVGWALGYMINATTAIPEEEPTDPVLSTPLFVILLLLSVILIGLGIFFCTRARKTKRMAPSVP